MAIKSLNPYLIFNGQAAQAIQHYQHTLGATVGDVKHHRDLPGLSTPASANLVLHAVLRVGGGVVMLSDAPPGRGKPATIDNVQISLDFDDPLDMARRFEALAAGGSVVMALHDAHWGGTFGMLVDAYGVAWMFNCEKKKGAES